MTKVMLTVAVTGLLAAACSPQMREVGYWDGCDSGFADHNRTPYIRYYNKDPDRYASNAEYREAWDRGYARCVEYERRSPWIHRM